MSKDKSSGHENVPNIVSHNELPLNGNAAVLLRVRFRLEVAINLVPKSVTNELPTEFRLPVRETYSRS